VGAPVLECLRNYCVTAGNAWAAEVLALVDQVQAAHERAQQGGVHGPLKSLLDGAGVLAAFAPAAPAGADEVEPGVEAEMAGAGEGAALPSPPSAAAASAPPASASTGDRKPSEIRIGKKRERIEQFLRLLEKEEARNPEARLSEVLNALALDTAADDPEEKPGVRLMTVHAAKGLEFHTVFLPTLDDDVFPSKPNHTDTGMEEERRLFYVAMTRAKKRLFLSWPATKIHYRVVRDVVPSRFVLEIPADHLDGPLGKKDAEEKKAFLDDFFATIRAGLEGPTAGTSPAQGAGSASTVPGAS
jgi:hypothetical protein